MILFILTSLIRVGRNFLFGFFGIKQTKIRIYFEIRSKNEKFVNFAVSNKYLIMKKSYLIVLLSFLMVVSCTKKESDPEVIAMR